MEVTTKGRDNKYMENQGYGTVKGRKRNGYEMKRDRNNDDMKGLNSKGNETQ